jgi:hypothetical protein
MANEILRYNRASVRSPKKNQRVRLAATVTPAASAVFNLTSRFGEYGRLRVQNRDLFFAYSHFPTPPFEYENQITFTGDVTEGQFAFTPDRRLVLFYATTSSLVGQYSTDDGLTWTFNASPAGTHGAVACAPDGTLGFAMYSGGLITFGIQPPGDPDFPVGISVVDSGGLLSWEDDSFRICQDLRGWWWLHGRISGEGATSLWHSEDVETVPGVMSWSRTSGSVTGLASGTHPGICCGHDGTLFAWANLGGNLKLSRRAPGDANWRSFVTVKDAAAANLAVGDAASSFALADEGPKRLVLATKITGESSVSDWHGADEAGATFSRFT